MIDRLRGILVEQDLDTVVIECSGVGYLVSITASTLEQLPPLGQELTLLTHFVVREDAQLLYGFTQSGDRALFRALLKINGVGARIALAILSAMSADSFADAVGREDVNALTQVPGIGKKLAQRLIVEMRDRIAGAGLGKLASASLISRSVAAEPKNEAIAGLEALGYKPLDASKLVNSIIAQSDQTLSSEALIRAALKSLGSRS